MKLEVPAHGLLLDSLQSSPYILFHHLNVQQIIHDIFYLHLGWKVPTCGKHSNTMYTHQPMGQGPSLEFFMMDQRQQCTRRSLTCSSKRLDNEAGCRYFWTVYGVPPNSRFKRDTITDDYPLVNSHITMGNHIFLMGKSTISMAMFNSYVTNYQRIVDFEVGYFQTASHVHQICFANAAVIGR